MIDWCSVKVLVDPVLDPFTCLRHTFLKCPISPQRSLAAGQFFRPLARRDGIFLRIPCISCPLKFWVYLHPGTASSQTSPSQMSSVELGCFEGGESALSRLTNLWNFCSNVVRILVSASILPRCSVLRSPATS